MRDKVKKSLQGLGKTLIGLVSMNIPVALAGVKQTLQGVVKK